MKVKMLEEKAGKIAPLLSSASGKAVKCGRSKWFYAMDLLSQAQHTTIHPAVFEASCISSSCPVIAESCLKILLPSPNTIFTTYSRLEEAGTLSNCISTVGASKSSKSVRYRNYVL